MANARRAGARMASRLLLIVPTGVLAVLAGAALGPAAAQDDGIEVVRREDLDRGASRRVSLAGVERAQAGLKKKLSASVGRASVRNIELLDGPLDAGLPACRGSGERSVRLDAELPRSFAGRRILFADLRGAALALPEEIAGDPSAAVLVMRARRLSDLADAARDAGRPVAAGSAELARSVGVRCVPSWIEIGEDRHEVRIHEGH